MKKFNLNLMNIEYFDNNLLSDNNISVNLCIINYKNFDKKIRSYFTFGGKL